MSFEGRGAKLSQLGTTVLYEEIKNHTKSLHLLSVYYSGVSYINLFNPQNTLIKYCKIIIHTWQMKQGVRSVYQFTKTDISHQ